MTSTDPSPVDPPFGIASRHDDVGRFAVWRTPLAVLVIVGVILAAFTGWLGGGADEKTRFDTPLATIELTHAGILRSGNWFETQVRITPRQALSDLVVGIDDPLWRGMSIDTIVPDAESATALDGVYAYHFGKVEAGQPFVLKFDGQIQPRSFRRLEGSLHVADGQAEIATIPLHLTVLP